MVEKCLAKKTQCFFCQKSLLLLDSCKAHLTAEVKSMISNSRTNLAVIPGGLTGKLQPLDLTVNRSFKSRLRDKWEQWMLTNIHEYTRSGKIKKASYEEICRWIDEAWNGITVDCVINGFKAMYISTVEETDENTSIIEKELSNVPTELLQAISSFTACTIDDFYGFE